MFINYIFTLVLFLYSQSESNLLAITTSQILSNQVQSRIKHQRYYLWSIEELRGS